MAYRLRRLLRHIDPRRATGRGAAAVWLWALLVGLISGYATLGFRAAIQAVQYVGFGEYSERLASAAGELSHGRVWLVPIAAGVIVGALLWLGHRLRLLPETRALGVADAIEARAVRGGRIKLKEGLFSAAVAAVSLGGGASTGREGPAVHLGASLASAFGRWARLRERDGRTLLACGAAAAVAASFNAPIAGAVFALEVVLGHYALRVIAPVAAASTVGALVARLHFGENPAFVLPEFDPATLIDFPAAALLGVIAGGVAIVFMRATIFAQARMGQAAVSIGAPLWALPPMGGLLVGALAVRHPEVLGVGYEATDLAIAGAYGLGALLVLLLVKILATTISLGFRFGGGVFSPALFLGAVVGATFGLLAHAVPGLSTADVSFYAVVGMGALSGAVLGAPLSTTLIVFEMTKSYEASIAVLVAVSLATVLVQKVMGASIFQLQIESHGYVLREGPQRIILKTVRIRDFMTPIDRLQKESVLEGPCLYVDDTLGRALGFLEAESLDGAPVKSRRGDEHVVGYITRADALLTYNRRLVEEHVERTR